MKLLDNDPFTGIKTYFEHNAETGKNILMHVQDVEPIVEFNKHAAGMLDKKKDWWFVGQIPNVICLQWAEESNTKIYSKEWVEYAKKKLKDPDYRAFNQNRIKL